MTDRSCSNFMVTTMLSMLLRNGTVKYRIGRNLWTAHPENEFGTPCFLIYRPQLHELRLHFFCALDFRHRVARSASKQDRVYYGLNNTSSGTRISEAGEKSNGQLKLKHGNPHSTKQQKHQQEVEVRKRGKA
eukprot:scpid103726/ scgid10269/ 